jgi:hypothetical protein
MIPRVHKISPKIYLPSNSVQSLRAHISMLGKLGAYLLNDGSSHLKAHFATMTLPSRQDVLLCLLCTAHALVDDTPFGCVFDISGVHHNMNILNEERTITQYRPSSPSTIRVKLRLNICGDFKKQDGVKDSDQVGKNIAPNSRLKMRLRRS